jgi:hypothetical protein
MTAMRPVPRNIPHEELVAVLEDITARVRAGDSYEGNITWSIPEDPAAPPTSVDVIASYRVGNLQGQGGMRMIGEWAEAPVHAGAVREQLVQLSAAGLAAERELAAITAVLDMLDRIERTGVTEAPDGT